MTGMAASEQSRTAVNEPQTEPRAERQLVRREGAICAGQVGGGWRTLLDIDDPVLQSPDPSLAARSTGRDSKLSHAASRSSSTLFNVFRA